MNKIIIPLSRTKTVSLFLGSILFILAAIWILFIADNQTRYNPLLLKIIAVIGILFFGVTGFSTLKSFFDTQPGLIIDENGITDNSSGVSAGLIEWNDINGIRIEQVMSTKFLLIDVINPEKYIARVNFFKRRLMKSNMKMYGTPLSISSTVLKYEFADLVQLIRTEFNKTRI